MRNLNPDEIYDQVVAIDKESRLYHNRPLSNIVFMGMGEPLANFSNLTKSIEIINADWGTNIGARRITVSTSGLAPQIEKLAQVPLQIRLAISLHGATDEVRNRIMPIMHIIGKEAGIERFGFMPFDEVNRPVGLDLHFFPALAGNDFAVPEGACFFYTFRVGNQPVTEALERYQ